MIIGPMPKTNKTTLALVGFKPLSIEALLLFKFLLDFGMNQPDNVFILENNLEIDILLQKQTILKAYFDKEK